MGEPKWQQIYNRLADQARGKLDDVPFIERVVDAADVRAEGFSELRADLAPLRRLVISYIRDSYREISRADVAQAVAAISYVASPLDAWPDTLPGGLKDDAKVVSWVADKLHDQLGEYAAWEVSLAPPESLKETVVSALAFARQSEMEVSVVDPGDALLAGNSGGGAPSAAVLQQALRSSKQVSDALHEGMVLRVLGPKHLLKGLKRGSLELVPTATGKTGTVRDVASKDFVGNLRIGQPGAAQAAKAAVSIGWAMASAVTMQHYLHDIDRKLGGITHELKDLHDEQLDRQLGELDTALQRCREVQEVIERTGGLGVQDVGRLDAADDRADDVFNALARSLGRFGEEVDSSVDALDAVEKEELGRLLEDATEKRITQLRMLIYASCVRDRVNVLRILAAGQDGEARVRLADETLGREHAEMFEAVRAACVALERLHLPKSLLDDRWPHLGGPEKELVDYIAAARRLVGEEEKEGQPLAIESGEPAALTPPRLTLTELWVRDGELMTERVEVRQRV